MMMIMMMTMKSTVYLCYWRRYVRAQRKERNVRKRREKRISTLTMCAMHERCIFEQQRVNGNHRHEEKRSSVNLFNKRYLNIFLITLLLLFIRFTRG